MPHPSCLMPHASVLKFFTLNWSFYTTPVPTPRQSRATQCHPPVCGQISACLCSAHIAAYMLSLSHLYNSLSPSLSDSRSKKLDKSYNCRANACLFSSANPIILLMTNKCSCALWPGFVPIWYRDIFSTMLGLAIDVTIWQKNFGISILVWRYLWFDNSSCNPWPLNNWIKVVFL